MEITFDEATHSYFVDGELADISVTELLAKHNLAPKYDNASSEVVEQAREKGKAIHKDLEDVTKGETPLTKYGEIWRKYLLDHYTDKISEIPVAIKYGNKIIAGTMDFCGYDGRYDIVYVADHKCMKQIHKDTVSWQVSIYDYMRKKQGLPFANKFLCFQWYDNKMKVHELKKVPDEEIERLLDCECKGEIYSPKQLEVKDDLLIQWQQAEDKLAEIEQTYKNAEMQAKGFRDMLKAKMETENIKSVECEKWKLTYVDETTSTTVDSKKLKEKYADVYADCQKTTKKSAYVKITLKGE